MRTVIVGMLGVMMMTPAWLAACGSSSIALPAPVTMTLDGSASLDGYVDTLGAAQSNGGGPWTGDLDASTQGRGGRQFFSFDLTSLPAGATVTQALLQLDQRVVNGTPYASHGIVVADHVDYGASLDPTDFSAPALQADVGTVSADATVGVKTLDVTANVQADLAAARTRSQYRVRFTILDTDSDGDDDHALFLDTEFSNFGSGQIPQLVVTYLP